MKNFSTFKKSIFSLLFTLVFYNSIAFSSLNGDILPPRPEIDVYGNAILIADGDTTPSTADGTDFGSVLVTGGSLVRTFTISNVGDNPSPYILLSGDVSEFTITALPASPVNAFSSTTFQITFDPTSIGTKTVEINIQTNVTGQKADYTFTLQGIGTAPEINITGNGTTIVDGDTTPTTADFTDFGSVATGSNFSRTFTIQNTGNSNLNLTGSSPYVAISGVNAVDYSVTAIPTTPITASFSSRIS